MKIAIISLGCPKNQVDADVFCHSLISAGHTTTADPAEADAIIVNTCGFIESAKTEAIENILDACALKERKPGLKVIVTGCLAERYRQEIRKEMPEVDAVVGIGCNAALPAILERLAAPDAAPEEDFGPKTDLALGGKRVISTPAHYAYLKIAEGCNNRCHYCAIPLIRGPLRSRPLEDCVAEARWLAGEGVKELVVVAQDPTAYGEDWGKNSICQLLDELNAVEGIRWIRILYAYPERITDEFIAAMQRNEKVVRYLDLPIQHCNTRILKAMNRRGDGEVVKAPSAACARPCRTSPCAPPSSPATPARPRRSSSSCASSSRTPTSTGWAALPIGAEEGTPAARMEQLPEERETAPGRRIMDMQAGISARCRKRRWAAVQTVICDGVDEESGLYLCRSAADAPEIDGNVMRCQRHAPLPRPVLPGEDRRERHVRPVRLC